MEIRTNRDSYKNRNKNKVYTLIGNEQVYLDILSLEFEADNKSLTLKDILEKTFENQYRLEVINSNLLEEINNLNAKMTELKQELKKYIAQENEVDKALTSAADLISIKVAQCEASISELKDKTRYL